MTGWLRIASVALLGSLLAACSSNRGAVQLAPGVPSPASAPAPRPAQNIGRVQAVQWPLLRIDDRQLRAAPGARIVNVSTNLLITANQIPPNAQVSFELDGTGQVRLLRVLPPGDGRVRSPGGAPRAGPQ